MSIASERTPSMLDRIRHDLVGLKMPSALEALDQIVRRLEHAEISALEAIDILLSEELTLRENRRIKTALRMGRWMRQKVGIKDRSKVAAHSWRHRMEDELRRARVPAEAADAITGRNNPRNSGASYGRGYRGMPDEVLKELRKVPSPI